MPTNQQPAREMRLSDAGIAQQQHRLQVQGVVARQAQRELAPDVLQRRLEIRHLVDQPVDVGQRRRLDREALAPEPDHPDVGGAQRLVGVAAQVLQLVQRLLDPGNMVDVLESGDRDRALYRGRKRSDFIHRSVLVSGPVAPNRAVRCPYPLQKQFACQHGAKSTRNRAPVDLRFAGAVPQCSAKSWRPTGHRADPTGPLVPRVPARIPVLQIIGTVRRLR
jgi:hypothetical protein